MSKYTVMNTALIAGLAVGGIWWLSRWSAQTAKDVGTAFNPTDSRNLANRGAQGLWDIFTDGKGTIGTDLYDYFNPGQ